MAGAGGEASRGEAREARHGIATLCLAGTYFPFTTFRLPDCPYSYQKGLLPLTVCPYIAIYKTDISFLHSQVPSDARFAGRRRDVHVFQFFRTRGGQDFVRRERRHAASVRRQHRCRCRVRRGVQALRFRAANSNRVSVWFHRKTVRAFFERERNVSVGPFHNSRLFIRRPGCYFRRCVLCFFRLSMRARVSRRGKHPRHRVSVRHNSGEARA